MIDDKKMAFECGLRPMVDIDGFDWRKSITDRMKHYDVPGVSIAVVEDDTIVWSDGYGMLDATEGTQLTADSVLQVASISKAVSAAGFLSLVQDDLVDLDEDLNTYLASWKIPDNLDYPDSPVTLRQILSHTSGLTVEGFLGYDPHGELPDLVQILRGESPANSGPVVIATRPGSVCNYSGGGTVAATLMTSELLGESFPATMRERVLRPLGMTNSFYTATLPNDFSGQVASGHRKGTPLEHHYVATPELGPDGLWSTATDIAKFGIGLSRMFRGKSSILFDRSIAMQMLTPQQNARIGDGQFGLGPILTGEGDYLRFGHSGYNIGFMSNFVHYANGSHGAAVITNADEGFPLLNEIIYTLAEIYDWPGYHRPRYAPFELSAKQLAAYVGSFEFTSGGLDGGVHFEMFDGNVQCTIDAGYIPPNPIIPIGEDRFALTESPHIIRFSRNPDNAVTKLTFVLEGTAIWNAEKTQGSSC